MADVDPQPEPGGWGSLDEKPRHWPPAQFRARGRTQLHFDADLPCGRDVGWPISPADYGFPGPPKACSLAPGLHFRAVLRVRQVARGEALDCRCGWPLFFSIVASIYVLHLH